MKRKHAITFGILMAGVLGYTIWCSRQFYLRPELLVDHQIPPEAEEVIFDWKENRGGFRPARLSLDGLVESISFPTRSEPPPAVAILESPTEIRVMHDGRSWFFIRVGDRWALAPTSP
jgi:hypothetical protein